MPSFRIVYLHLTRRLYYQTILFLGYLEAMQHIYSALNTPLDYAIHASVTLRFLPFQIIRWRNRR